MSSEKEIFLLKQEIKALMESTPDAIYSTDENGVVVHVNSVFEEMFQLASNEVVGQNIGELKNTGQYPESVALISIDQKQPVTLMESMGTQKLMVSAYPALSSEGKVLFVIVKIRDITELTAVKDELEQVKKMTTGYINELKVLRSREDDTKGVIAINPEMEKIIDLASRVALVDTTVVISGESGTGKEVIAQLIHDMSPRKEYPFIKINCGAIPEALLESELFGYEAGAFTGAREKGKSGLFEIASKGTLLLDEIGDMPMSLQVKLLRVLQDQIFYRVGGTRTVQTNARILAATHRDLKKMVKSGTFREDLYYRLNVVQMVLPPLRERPEDIIPLTYRFLERSNKKYRFNKTISGDVIEYLLQYQWPGNVRELENVIERMVVLCRDDVIQKEVLPLAVIQPMAKQKGYQQSAELQVGIGSLEQETARFEKHLIQHYLNKYHSIQAVADHLQVHRTTILRKCKKYGLI